MNSAQTQTIQHADGNRSGFQQRLNAADRLMLVAHDVMRNIGHPGFQCQTHVWLDGRIDVAMLRQTIATLAAAYPVVASRLSRDSVDGPTWYAAGSLEPEFVEKTLAGSDKSDVWSYGEALFAKPLDLSEHPPIGFHLLHLPDGRDVLLIRFSHALMDGKSPEFALSELNRLQGAGSSPVFSAADGEGVYAATQAASRPTESTAASIAAESRNEMAEHLGRFERKKRIDAAIQVIKSQLKLPTKAVSISTDSRKQFTFEPLRILVKELTEDETKAATARVRKLCGFANLTPAVLAAVFRGVRQYASTPIKKRTLQTDVPLNLRLPGAIQPVFRNHVTFIQMHAKPAEMEDRDELTKALNANMRDQLRRGIDLGNLQMMSMMAKFPKLMAMHLKQRFRDNPISLGFGFLGPVLPSLETFLGRKVEWIYTLNSCLSPPGIVLQVNQFRGKMNLILTYIDHCVPEKLANDLLAFIIQDLV